MFNWQATNLTGLVGSPWLVGFIIREFQGPVLCRRLFPRRYVFSPCLNLNQTLSLTTEGGRRHHGKHYSTGQQRKRNEVQYWFF